MAEAQDANVDINETIVCIVGSHAGVLSAVELLTGQVLGVSPCRTRPRIVMALSFSWEARRAPTRSPYPLADAFGAGGVGEP